MDGGGGGGAAAFYSSITFGLSPGLRGAGSAERAAAAALKG